MQSYLNHKAIRLNWEQWLHAVRFGSIITETSVPWAVLMAATPEF
jgi:hypothetical protein